MSLNRVACFRRPQVRLENVPRRRAVAESMAPRDDIPFVRGHKSCGILRSEINPMCVTPDYGRTGLVVGLPDADVVGPVGVRPAPPLQNPQAAVDDAPQEPIGTP